jgi:glycerophosphoryl diester phosphodiesterase
VETDRGPHPYLDGPHPRAFAHRGGTEAAPENSLAAFAHAVSLGYTHLETDVHLTADGVLIAFHDDELDRVTNRTGRVADLTASKVREALIGGVEPIPTFDELLDAFPTARFNVDAKSDEAVVPLAEVISRRGLLGRVCVGSFSDERLERIRALLGPDLCTAAGPREIGRLVAAERLPGPLSGPVAAPREVPYRCLQVPVRHRGIEIVTPALIEAAHDRGCEVHVWTIDEPAEMHRLFDLGVDGIMTDRPAVLREVIAERGASSAG